MSGAVAFVGFDSQAMQRAAGLRSSGMCALLGLSRAEADLYCQAVGFVLSQSEGGEQSLCSVANALAKGNYVMAGTQDALSLAQNPARLREELARERPHLSEEARREQERLVKELKTPRKVVPLKVSGGFHSQLMAPAAAEVEAALREVKLNTPRIPVISNVDCKPHFDAQEIKQILVRQVSGASASFEAILIKTTSSRRAAVWAVFGNSQLTSPVQWEGCLEELAAKGVRRTFEFGPGAVLTGLVKKALPESVQPHVVE